MHSVYGIIEENKIFILPGIRNTYYFVSELSEKKQLSLLQRTSFSV